ncbi:hypothetical protein ACFC4G_46330 [Streptomyces sp. NPDC056002]|uniref:hypothetical protein n=1 Tax=Streptomyces sp. NPDC056002 TaxID=3345675 RepID=UPI0035E17680
MTARHGHHQRSTDHAVQGETDVAELADGAQLKRQVGPTLPMALWLGGKGRIRRRQVGMTVTNPRGGNPPKQAKVRAGIGLSGFGAEVESGAPPADDVTDRTGEALGDKNRGRPGRGSSHAISNSGAVLGPTGPGRRRGMRSAPCAPRCADRNVKEGRVA